MELLRYLLTAPNRQILLRHICKISYTLLVLYAMPDEPFRGNDGRSDFYAIDGQALEPTAFGRENNQGVWVPREVDFSSATMRAIDMIITDTPASEGVWTPDFNSTELFTTSKQHF